MIPRTGLTAQQQHLVTLSQRYNTNIQAYYETMRLSLTLLSMCQTSQHPGNPDIRRYTDEIAHQINRNTRMYNTTFAEIVNALATSSNETIITYNILPENPPMTTTMGISSELLTSATESGVFEEVAGDTPPVCPITMEPFVAGDAIRTIRHCGHRFRARALENWFLRSTVCPVCRHDVNPTPTISGNGGSSDEWLPLFEALLRGGRSGIAAPGSFSV